MSLTDFSPARVRSDRASGHPVGSRWSIGSVIRRRVLRPAYNAARRPYVQWQMARSSDATICGHAFLTEPAVFHPGFFSSTEVLARAVARAPLAGRRVLDMGTGSGVIAVVAAAAGAAVTACDINAAAVRLARLNARRNGLEIEVIESDLFANCCDLVFDVIYFNVPFYAHNAHSALDRAFFAGPKLQTIRRFAEQSPRHLVQGGQVVIIVSEECDRRRMYGMFVDAGLRLAGEEVARRRLEKFYVAQFVLQG